MKRYAVPYDLAHDGRGGFVPQGWPGALAAAGWSVASFATLAEAEAFRDRTNIFGRRAGRRIQDRGARSSAEAVVG